jgi:hypothetical protein
MWKQLSEASFNIAHIVIGGDFNHLEEINRRGKAREHLLLRKEAATWHHMML